ncbi:TetR/AcrR family transcriptional regulator [Microbispora sp. NPDC049125]|uniref:TetR/AcrR family transcriptional regulator n=1 Tax=Microbispora sp. NPDC049125 TaxID=3154929 RepID=UPI0034678AF9
MSQQDVPVPPWERPRKRPAPARVPLTRERIIDAAFAVLDREGYDKMSMRQVAAELGVAVSALYAHVSAKDELLQLMYNRMLRSVELPDPDPENWQEQIKEFARDGRTRMLSHRDMARISMEQTPFTPELLPHIEKLLAIFRQAGLPDRVAAIAGDILSTFMDGFILQESIWQGRRVEAGESGGTGDKGWPEMRAEIQKYFAALPADRFPNMVALADLMVDESNDYRFDLGLDIILRGLASYIEEK